MTPFFSVIVPVYNIKDYIDKCVLSILRQTYTDYELILVDDGSSDGCSHICDEYARQDARIKVIHKKNGGSGSARQAGVSEAKGKYVVCIDGDDWVSENYLERFAEVIDRFSPDVVCCGSIWKYKDKNIYKSMGIEAGYYDRKKLEKAIFPILIERSDGVYFPSSIWAKAYRYDLYKQQQLLIDKSLKIGEDVACVKPIIYNAQSVYIIDDCLYYYRQNPDSMTKKKVSFDWNGPRLIGQHLERQIDMNSFDFQEQVYRSVVHNLFNVAVSQFNKDEPFSMIAKDIKEHIEESYYKNAIEKCRFTSIKGLLASIALKCKLTFLMYIYNCLKNRISE